MSSRAFPSMFALALGLGAMPLAAQTIARPLPDPAITDFVNLSRVDDLALQPDGSTLLAGDFTAIGGEARNGFARLHPDGTLDPAWNPQIAYSKDTDGDERYLAIAGEGAEVYVSGPFDSVDRRPLRGPARLTGRDGTQLDPRWLGATECAQAAHRPHREGRFLYVPSRCEDGGLSRIDLSAGTVVDRWAVGLRTVSAITGDGNGNLFVIAEPLQGGSRHNRLYRITGSGQIDADWNPPVAPDPGSNLASDSVSVFTIVAGRVQRLSAAGRGEPMAGWHYANVIEEERVLLFDRGHLLVGSGSAKDRGLVQLDGSTGQLQASYAAPAGAEVRALLRYADGSIGVGGRFTEFAGISGLGFVRLGAPGARNWQVDAETPAKIWGIVAQRDGGVIVYGQFARANGLTRRNVLRVRPDGRLDRFWRADTNGRVFGAATDSAGNVYLGGQFNQVNETATAGVAKLTRGGTVVAGWSLSPAVSTTTSSLFVDGMDRLYVDVRRYSSATGIQDGAWSVSSGVGALSVGQIDDRLYVGGPYVNSLPAYNAITSHDVAGNGAAAWQLSPLEASAVPRYLFVRGVGSSIVVGGLFTAPRMGLMKVLPGTGSAQVDNAWDAQANGFVLGLAAGAGGDLFVSGTYTSIGGASRASLAKLTSSGAAAADWIAELAPTPVADIGRGLALNGRGRVYVADPAVPNGFAAYPERADDLIFADMLE
ncbi:delta-60 repeat domain-containing protein [Tahibacter caeni]|uniref:delta-60 repeat domain-containing protein n=1 Tax=Tahibacter caeni TaxID=1453545 RepID=UPI002147EE73|nr:delta-60 repeat domain-containing protein [Tahibacter caeni]